MFTWRTCYVVETKYAHAVEEKSGTVNNKFENVCFSILLETRRDDPTLFCSGTWKRGRVSGIHIFHTMIRPIEGKVASSGKYNWMFNVLLHLSRKSRTDHQVKCKILTFHANNVNVLACEHCLFLLLYRSFTFLCARDYNTIFYSLNSQILYFLLSGRVARSGEPTQRPKIYFISFHTHRE